MRIAIFTEVFVPKIDGITNRLRQTLRLLRQQGHEALVFAPDTAVREYAGVRVVRVPGLPFPPYPGLRVSLPDPRIAWELARFAPSVVHAVGPVCLGAWGIAAARALALPVVASYHTDLPGYAPRYGLGFAQGAIWPLVRWIHNAAHVNLAPSRHTRDELLAHGVENVGLWRGGVDVEQFHPQRRCEAMRFRLTGGAPDEPVVLYAGRLSPEKNLELFEAVLDAIPEARAALVGDGPARPELERRLERRRTVFTGFLRGRELARAFASADVFLMPSRTETLGFVVLEAMSSGCPVVAARAGGIPDLVSHGENGFLFDPDRPEQAIDSIRALLESRAARRFYGQQARKAAEGCGWARETEKLVDSYSRAICINRQRGPLGRLQLAVARSRRPAA
jgi:glycosyltransferase involved in cell wall biosynthesis